MNRQDLTAELIRDEGLRLKPYRCTGGALTIGVGRNLDARGISEVEARVLLSNDIERVWREVTLSLPWVNRLSERRQRAICNLAFNMGISGLLDFKRTLAAIESGRYQEAAAMLLDSRYASQVGDRAKRVARQIEEG